MISYFWVVNMAQNKSFQRTPNAATKYRRYALNKDGVK